jgi:hypothetical protein
MRLLALCAPALETYKSAFIVRSIQPRIVESKLATMIAMPAVIATALARAATAKR